MFDGLRSSFSIQMIRASIPSPISQGFLFRFFVSACFGLTSVILRRDASAGPSTCNAYCSSHHSDRSSLTNLVSGLRMGKARAITWKEPRQTTGTPPTATLGWLYVAPHGASLRHPSLVGRRYSYCPFHQGL